MSEASALHLATIRALNAGEAEQRIDELCAILIDAVAHGASVNFLAGLTRQDAAAFWQGQIPGVADGSRILIVAERDEVIVGTVVLTLAHQPNAPHRAEIGKMLVHSRLRRQGLGARLLDAAEQTARKLGRTLLLLDTQTDSAGDKLYRNSGWVALGIAPDHALTPAGVPAPTTFFYKQL